MLNYPKYEGIWIEVMKKAKSGEIHMVCKDVKNSLLAANHHKYNDKTAMGAATQMELTAVQTRLTGQLMRTINRQIVRGVWGACLDEDDKKRCLSGDERHLVGSTLRRVVGSKTLQHASNQVVCGPHVPL